MTRRIRLIKSLINWHVQQNGPGFVPESRLKILSSLTAKIKSNGKKFKDSSKKATQIEIPGIERDRANYEGGIYRAGAS